MGKKGWEGKGGENHRQEKEEGKRGGGGEEGGRWDHQKGKERIGGGSGTLQQEGKRGRGGAGEEKGDDAEKLRQQEKEEEGKMAVEGRGMRMIPRVRELGETVKAPEPPAGSLSRRETELNA